MWLVTRVSISTCVLIAVFTALQSYKTFSVVVVFAFTEIADGVPPFFEVTGRKTTHRLRTTAEIMQACAQESVSSDR